jgi:hypothetical protein
MAFREPFAAYNAATNVDAHLVRDALAAAGIEAYAADDVSPVGVWMGGLVPELHKPQVWIEKDDAERAAPVLAEFDRRAADRRRAERDSTSGDLEAECEDCGKRSKFPAAQQGTVQTCPHCWSFMDVAPERDSGDWREAIAD